MNTVSQQGFSLFEVLIAMALLSFAIVGLNDWQLQAMQYNKAAILQNRAMNQLQALALRQEDDQRLPKERVKFIHHSDYDEMLISWRSLKTVWHCSIPKIAGRSCLSIVR